VSATTTDDDEDDEDKDDDDNDAARFRNASVASISSKYSGIN
jgi:hypothetical protein